MTRKRRRRASHAAPPRGLAELRRRLAEAEDTVRAIRAGEVDAVVVAGERGPQVFTLEGVERVYRTLIESMNEGALILATDQTILFANRRFSRMVRRPLEKVTGGSFRRYLADDDRVSFRSLLAGADKSDSMAQVSLVRGDGPRLSAQISVRKLPSYRGGSPVVGVVVTDMTEVRRNEQKLRDLTRRVVHVQEAERARVALELHDHVTQLLCTVLLRGQALANVLSRRDGKAKDQAMELRGMVSRAAQEVERISRGLRPGVLAQLGLVSALRGAGAEFADRTGVSVKLACVKLTERLSADAELALYRVLQEAMRNVAQHAGARHVAVRLTQPGRFVRLSITDDGTGFDPDRLSAARGRAAGLGLLSMHERAAYVGGALDVRSTPGAGTTISARIPLAFVGGGAA